jgi:hypothetical protein
VAAQSGDLFTQHLFALAVTPGQGNRESKLQLLPLMIPFIAAGDRSGVRAGG